MSNYHSHYVNLSKDQMQKLVEALYNNSATTIRLANHELTGPDEIMLTKTQIDELKLAINGGISYYIEMSKTQIRKTVVQGGSLWSSLISKVLTPLVNRSHSRSWHPLY